MVLIFNVFFFLSLKYSEAISLYSTNKRELITAKGIDKGLFPRIEINPIEIRK